MYGFNKKEKDPDCPRVGPTGNTHGQQGKGILPEEALFQAMETIVILGHLWPQNTYA
jgi:hypothetical protein